MKKVFFFSAVLFFACRQKTEQPLWPDEKTARIGADLSVAEPATNGLIGFSHDSLMQLYFRQVLDMHQVSLADYEKNLQILAQDVPRLGAVLDSAQAILKKKVPPGGASKLNIPQ